MDRTATPLNSSMTTRAPYTQAQLQRAIRAAKSEGLRVTGIKPDGTIEVVDGTESETVPDARVVGKWANVRA